MNNVTANILRFLAMLILQVFLCDYIHLFGFITPAFYLLALFLLSLDMPKSAQYLIGFATGFIVDMFGHTLGVNAAACTVIMAIRPSLTRFLNGRKVSDTVDKPTPGVKNFKWLVLYAATLTLLHQTLVIMIETATFNRFGHTLLCILGNSVLSAFFILCAEYIFYPVKGKAK